MGLDEAVGALLCGDPERLVSVQRTGQTRKLVREVVPAIRDDQLLYGEVLADAVRGDVERLAAHTAGLGPVAAVLAVQRCAASLSVQRRMLGSGSVGLADDGQVVGPQTPTSAMAGLGAELTGSTLSASEPGRALAEIQAIGEAGLPADDGLGRLCELMGDLATPARRTWARTAMLTRTVTYRRDTDPEQAVRNVERGSALAATATEVRMR